jgi:hypothetical protein
MLVLHQNLDNPEIMERANAAEQHARHHRALSVPRLLATAHEVTFPLVFTYTLTAVPLTVTISIPSRTTS